MRLLSIDVSSSKDPHNGWSFWNGKEFSDTGCFPYTSPSDYVVIVIELIKKYKPTCVFYADSHGRYNVIRAHSRLHAYLDLAADEMGIQSQAISEPHAKKVVIGKGRCSKEEIMEHFNEEDSDIADSKLLIACYLLEYNSN